MNTLANASLLVIGDEILSGRTQDRNIAYMGAYLSDLGIDLIEVRIVPDKEEAIVAAVNELRVKTTYLFTTGGIGPTHDDITADCIAKAFNVPIEVDARAVALLKERYGENQLNDSRLRMARIPQGAELIANPVSKAPGFILGNVYVMAGVPEIMQAMLDEIAPRLTKNKPLHVMTIEAKGVKEGDYAAPLRAIALRYQDVTMGSTPRFTANGFENNLVLRGRSEASITAAAQDVQAMLAQLRQV